MPHINVRYYYAPAQSAGHRSRDVGVPSKINWLYLIYHLPTYFNTVPSAFVQPKLVMCVGVFMELVCPLKIL